MKFLDNPPRFLFFTGKGGVGKTSVACATALHLARAGKSVLLVSTDPASNVGQVFGVTIGNTVTPMEAVPGLSTLEIDPEQAADAYRERIIGPVRGLLPDKEILSITEQLSGSCTTEIASFNEFTSLLADEGVFGHFDHVVFDTAPTGHTLRLLQLPGSWTDFLQAGMGDASCLGPLGTREAQGGLRPGGFCVERPSPDANGSRQPPAAISAGRDGPHPPRTHPNRNHRSVRRYQRRPAACIAGR